MRVDEVLHASYRIVGIGYQSHGVLMGDLALLVEIFDLGAEAHKVGTCVHELALIQLGARAAELADQARLVLRSVLAGEVGALGRRPQIVDLGLALIDGLGLGGRGGRPQEHRH